MYHLSPITLRPDVRASRNQHGKFQNKLEDLVRKIRQETEVVDLENPHARLLFNSMDTFFSYGLLSGEKLYWRFVREFLPHTEQDIIRAEWGKGSDRMLSLAWLKDAFNKGTLYFQMLAFKANRKIITRFYHSNACMNNKGMLEKVTDMMDQLMNVQFAFYIQASVLAHREVVQAVAVEPPPIVNAKKVKARRRRRLTESDRLNPVTPNEPIPANIHELMQPTPIDQEVILDRLVRERNQRIYNESDEFAVDKDSTRESTDMAPDQLEQEGLANVYQRVIEQVRTPDEESSRSFDNLLQVQDLKTDVPLDDLADDDIHSVEGEIVLHEGEKLKLTVDVFIDENEKLAKIYQVFGKFAVGVAQQRLLAITDHNIYVLSQSVALDDSSLEDTIEEGVNSSVVYHRHVIIPYDVLDYIGASLDYQILIFYAKTGTTFKVESDEAIISEKMCAISVGEMNLGAMISKSISMAADNGHRQAPSVFTESTAYSLILKRYVTNELGGAPHVDLNHLSLVFWKESSSTLQSTDEEHSSYFYHRTVYPNWGWRKTAVEWNQSYFMLRGSKIYVFTDSTCKEGENVYDLSQCTETIELEPKKDCQWAFEMIFPDGSLQLQCPSKDELSKWMQLVSIALSLHGDDEAVACMLILTETHILVCQEGEKCVADGFIRTLMTIPLIDIRTGWIVRSDQHMALLLCVDTNFEWFFFRTETELDRMITSLSKYPIDVKETSNYPDDKQAIVAQCQCRRAKDSWCKTVFAKEETELEL